MLLETPCGSGIFVALLSVPRNFIGVCTGSFAERLKWDAFLYFTVAWEILVYFPVCHWIWGRGFLHQMGLLDYAGGIVIHTTAGVGVWFLAHTLIMFALHCCTVRIVIGTMAGAGVWSILRTQILFAPYVIAWLHKENVDTDGESA